MNNKYSQVPQELKTEARWVNWKYNNDGRKVPYQPTMKLTKADATRESTWATFKEAESFDYKFDGIGFVLGKQHIGIDFDDCFDPETPTHELTIPDLAVPFIGAGYFERSPSRKGFKIIIDCDQIGEPPPNFPKGATGGRNEKLKIEVYFANRYFTVTGDVMAKPNGALSDFADINGDALIKLLKVVKPEWWELNGQPKPTVDQKTDLNDEQLLEKARHSKNGEKFKALFDDGDLSYHDNDASKADAGLLGLLGWWTNYDVEWMDKLFRKSALYGEVDRKSNADDYITKTIDSVIRRNKGKKGYSGNGSAKKVEKKAEPKEEKKEKEATVKEQSQIDELFTDKGVLKITEMADYLTDVRGMKFTSLGLEPNTLRILENGVYRKDFDNTVIKTIKQLSKGQRREHEWYNKVINLLIDENRHDPKEGVFPGLHEDYINVQNGMIEIETGELISHKDFYKQNPDVISLIQLPVVFDPDADCPIFDEFLLEKMGGCRDTADLIYQVFGYTLLQYIPIPAFIEFHGETHTGKSTVFKVLFELLGRGNYSTEPVHGLDDLENRFARSSLYGKLANIDADSSTEALKGDGLLKKLSAGDPISIEKKFGDARSEQLFATSLHSANYNIQSEDKSSGHLSRLIRIPFIVSHEGQEVRLIEKGFTTPTELSGILNRALAGVQRLLKTGQFISTERTAMAKEEFKVANDPVLKWLDDNCVTDKETFRTLNGNTELYQQRIDPARIWKRYRDVTKSNIDNRNFYKSLKEWADAGFKNGNRFDNTGRGNYIPGLDFIQDDDTIEVGF